MPAQRRTLLCHPGDGHFGGWKPEEEKMDFVASSLQLLQPCRVRSAGERGFEAEADTGRGQFAQSPAHDAAGLKGDAILGEGRKPLGDRVGVDELIDLQCAAQQTRGRRRFAGSVRAAKHHRFRRDP